MDDPLLSSLCSICHINTLRYTCPRCSIQTCSLPCSRRHKLWSECSGVRDPTVFKPMSQLATPSGIDHDYNFLHSIEHKIERSEKRIVEDRGLVAKGELAAARSSKNANEWHMKMQKRKRQVPGQEPIERHLKMMRTTVELAPKGMKRSVENATSWSRSRRSIHWQVEWIRDGSTGRSLCKVMGNKAIGEAYAEHLEEERKTLLTDAEKRLEKKQKAKERDRDVHAQELIRNLSTSSTIQDTETTAWGAVATPTSVLNTIEGTSMLKPSMSGGHFYLLRPKTPSSFPKVLTPLSPSNSLEKLLRRRLVLEFPTIYVLEAESNNLSDEFMLEKDFLSAIRQPPWQNSDTEMPDGSVSSSEDPETETSSSDSDLGGIMEEGEAFE